MSQNIWQQMSERQVLHNNFPYLDTQAIILSWTMDYVFIPCSHCTLLLYTIFINPTPRNALFVRSLVRHVFYPHLTRTHTNLICERFVEIFFHQKSEISLKIRNFPVHAHKSDWCACALDGGKKRDQRTDGRTRRF